ncbi:sulfite exporter TauE/SafE family protein [Jeongeupia naejangsanensis]|uniref:Probable membrane transporter protein n=1 Tax=Jeongeupia naejangsanensis TaxID=613195 RepID=A0ABS2BJB9_9NEIS|nr:sulfite exporter TauE/SafE family protein [Jeongeupia naejangsanensis]MBM3115712.1 sulfite exporter TauE/SafE family protein [Jeongeupia naejangsanensis]
MLIALLACLGLGLVAGVLAGLLGVGGGLVIVPGLLFVFHLVGLPETHQQHLALGTSLATIVFTSIASFRAHAARGAVRWPVFRAIAPGIIVGTFVGAQLAALFSGVALKWFFVGFAYLVGAQMLADLKPAPSRQLPGLPGMSGVGGVIGAVSSWVGIGGGSLSVPFMTLCNVPVREAIGTSAAIGLPIALAGAAGYVASGWHAFGLPPGSAGFVYLPALAGIVIASFPMAKVGAWLAHRLPVPVLKKCFALLLIVLATKMLLTLV